MATIIVCGIPCKNIQLETDLNLCFPKLNLGLSFLCMLLRLTAQPISVLSV